MALSSYNTFSTNLLLGRFGDFTSVTIKCAAVTASYTYQASHETYADISSYVLGTTTLTNGAVSNGEYSCDNFSFSGISSGTAAAVVYYLDSGTPSTSYLIAYDSSATNLPYTFTGTTVLVTVPSYLFKILSAS